MQKAARMVSARLSLSPVLEAPARHARLGSPNLVYAGSEHEAKTVTAAGKVLVADEAAVRAEAQLQAEEVARCVAADSVHSEMALLKAIEAGQMRKCPPLQA